MSPKITDLHISPTQNCVGWFEHITRPNEEIKWIGFDKYKKILYGVRKIYQTKNRKYETVMQSIFGGEPRVIKSFLVDYPDGNDLAAMSKGAEYICLWVDVDVHFGNYWQNSVYLIYLETGVVNRYRLLPFLKISHGNVESFMSSSSGWICCVCDQYENDIPRTFTFYRFIFDESEKTISFVLLTKCMIDYMVTPPIIYDREIFIFSLFGDLLKVYDIEDNVWSCRQNEKKLAKLFFLVSDDGRNVLAIPDFDKPETSKFSLIELSNNNSWDKTSVTLNLLKLKGGRFQTPLCHVNNVVFINIKMKRQRLLAVNFVVLSLQDIAVKRIFDYCNRIGLELNDFMTYVNLSPLMQRMYCGSPWIWEDDNEQHNSCKI